VLCGLILGVAVYKAYDRYKFPPGSPDPDQAYESLYGPIWTSNPLPGLANLAVSPSAGVLWYCPTVLLSLAGWWAWRREHRWFCWSVLAASLIFTLFLSFLTFFKGDPCWGPRYLTPVLALWWVFVPAAATRVRRSLLVGLLALGCLIQLLALAVDPHRLVPQEALHTKRSDVLSPWLGFHPQASHLLRRPREIAEILARSEPPPPPPAVPAGHAEPPVEPFFRPWWIAQRYLAPADRPVDLDRTFVLLAALAAGGLGLLLTAATVRGRSAAGS
jgi:hypothetical protein